MNHTPQKPHPSYLRPVPDYPSRIAIENRRMAEERETARRDVSNIVRLWATKAWQRAHTAEQGEDGIA